MSSESESESQSQSQSQSQSESDSEDNYHAQDTAHDKDEPSAESMAIQSHRLPVSHEILLKDHRKVVSALDLDSAGSRLFSGGYDYALKYWDWHGMDSTCRPFRSIEPCGAYNIRDVKFSRLSDKLLVVPNSAQAKIYDRDGHELQEYVKGDQYLVDMKKTNGHVSAINCGDWHPTEAQTFLTASMDSTVRIWDANDKKKQKDLILIKSKNGAKSNVCFAKFSPDGRTVVSASEDGSLKLWSSKAPFNRPLNEVEQAHVPGCHISSIAQSASKHSIVTRASDGTLKFWDSRRLVKPVHVISDLPNDYHETSCLFSPNEDLILTGTCSKRKEQVGDTPSHEFLMYNALDFSTVYRLPSASGVVRLVWHDKLNQIMMSKADGTIAVLYSPDYSQKGALLCAGKVSRPRESAYAQITPRIITPHSLPLFRDSSSQNAKRRREKDRKDPVKSHLPMPPVKGPGKGGRIGSNLTQHLMKNLMKNTMRDEDPREALLKYAKMAEDQPLFVAPAYQKTQPKTIFSTLPLEEEEEEQMSKGNK